MSCFSTNQARQFYVMKGALQTASNSNVSTTNTIKFVNSDPAAPYILALGAVDVLRSDLLTNIEAVKVTDALALAKPIKMAVVTTSSPQAGKDYTLSIQFKQFAGISDEELYFKYGFVRCTSAMASDIKKFYVALADSMKKNFTKEVSKLVETGTYAQIGGVKFLSNGDVSGILIVIGAASGNATTAPTATLSSGTLTITGGSASGADNSIAKINSVIDTALAGQPYTIKAISGTLSTTSVSATYIAAGVAVIEVPQTSEYRRGIKNVTPVYFDVVGLPIADEDDTWATVTNSTAGSVLNGYDIADLEYFCMGERGDVYRGMNWPHNIETSYLITPSATASFDVLDVQYSYAGSAENIQKSPKSLVVVAPHTNDLNSTSVGSKTDIVGLANKIAAAAGIKFTLVSKTGAASAVATA